MSIDLSLVKSLNLQDAFKEEGVIQRIAADDDYLEELFEHSNRATLMIHDDGELGHSCFVTDTKGLGSDKVLVVGNGSHGDAFLMHIDGVLFTDKSKCDCALVSAKEFDFIEFKSEAANKTEASREFQYDKCYNQLKTIVESFDKHYREAGEDFRKKFNSFRAFGVFNPTVPKDSASLKNLSIKFLKEVKIPLKFTNKTKLG